MTHDTSNGLDETNFPSAKKTNAKTAIDALAPTGDAFFDLMTGRAPKQPDPGKWKMPKFKKQD